jgi:hypothetical protein
MLGDGAKRRRFWMYDRTEGERLPTRGGGTRIAGLSSTMSDVERSAADAFVTTGRSPIHPAYSLELLGFDAGGVMCITTMAERHFTVLIKVPVPRRGFGQRLTQMDAWLDENCGSWGGDDAMGDARGARQSLLDLLRRRDPRQRLCYPMVCREQG